jgi:hypothetical protein
MPLAEKVGVVAVAPGLTRSENPNNFMAFSSRARKPSVRKTWCDKLPAIVARHATALGCNGDSTEEVKVRSVRIFFAVIGFLASAVFIDAYGQCVYCVTRTACMGTTRGAQICYIDRETGSCMTKGTCPVNDGQDYYDNPSWFGWGDGWAPWDPNDPWGQDHDQWGSLSISPTQLAELAKQSPRLAQGLMTVASVYTRTKPQSSVGEAVMPLKWQGADALIAAAKEGKALEALDGDTGDLRVGVQLLAKPNALMVTLRTKQASAGEVPDANRILSARFERGRENQYLLAAWRVSDANEYRVTTRQVPGQCAPSSPTPQKTASAGFIN